MFESDVEDNVFRRRLMKEVAPGVPVHFSFYSPSVKVQVMYPAEHMPGANGRYVGDAVTIEFVPKVAAAVNAEELRELVDEGDTKALGRLPGMGEKRARAVVEYHENERSERRFLYAANRNDRFRGKPVITELDLGSDLEGQVWDHAVRARRLGDPDPLGPNEPPGHTTVRNANLMHPLPMTPSLMSRGVYYPEQVGHFADTLRRVLVDGESLIGVGALRIQRGKLFHTTKMAGVGMKTRARVLASGLLDDEYTYESLVAIPGVTEAQARTIASAARAVKEVPVPVGAARTEVRVY